jgi:hypothetical protein
MHLNSVAMFAVYITKMETNRLQEELDRVNTFPPFESVGFFKKS